MKNILIIILSLIIICLFYFICTGAFCHIQTIKPTNNVNTELRSYLS